MPGVFVYVAVIGFLLGVAWRSLYSIPLWVLIFLGVAGLCVFVWGAWRRTRMSLVLGLFCCALSIGVVRAHSAFVEEPSFLDGELGQMVLEGVVIDEPVFTEKAQKVVIAVHREERVEKVLLITPLYPEFIYGDSLRVDGVLEKPSAFVTDTGELFDYPSYLAQKGIAHQVVYPTTVEVLRQGGGDVFHRFLFSLRRRFIETLHVYVPEPQATLAGGISIGAQDGMDTETKDVFRRVGLIHIVVLSGYNITIVADVVMRVASFLPRTLMISTGALTVVLFTIMTGASATAVRASVMALIAMLARLVGEKYDISRALALAGFGMVFVNPRILLFDPSFQLSFLATFGLIHLSPILEHVCVRVPTLFALRQTIASTLATQAFVVPLLVWKTGQVSLISLVANVLVLPVVPLAMFCSAVLGIFGSIVSLVGVLVSFPTTLVLSYIVTTARLLSRIPFASVDVPSSAFVFLVYAILLWWIWRSKNTKERGLASFEKRDL